MKVFVFQILICNSRLIRLPSVARCFETLGSLFLFENLISLAGVEEVHNTAGKSRSGETESKLAESNVWHVPIVPRDRNMPDRYVNE